MAGLQQQIVLRCMLSFLLAALLGGQRLAAAAAGGYAVPLYRKTGKARGRMLLRNSSYPLHGTVKDLGYFYATIYLGTPPKPFAVIVDTGSTITYVPCSTCGSNCGKHKDEAFDPTKSSTYNKLGCGDDKCKCGNPRCSCFEEQCFYTRHYAEQSSSQGVLIEDMFHFQDGAGAVPVVFGCETKETGEIFKQEADGIMGLGNSEVSLMNQMALSGHIEDQFSLCFGSVEGSGLLLLGKVGMPSAIEVRYTDLLPTQAHYYLVRLETIRLADQELALQRGIFDIGYGVVLDSGTTFTYLPTEAFNAFRDAVDKYAQAQGLKRVDGPDPRFQDECWGGAPASEERDELRTKFPLLELQFGGGLKLDLHPLNYLFMHTKEKGSYCLGVFDNGHQGTLLGGITFRNVLVEYDRANKRVGFGYANCQRLGQDMAPPCDALSAISEEAGADSSTGPASADCRAVPQPTEAAGGSGGAAPPPPPPLVPPPPPRPEAATTAPGGGQATGAAQPEDDAPTAGGQDSIRPGDEDAVLMSEEEQQQQQEQSSSWGSGSLWPSLHAAVLSLLALGLLGLLGAAVALWVQRRRRRWRGLGGGGGGQQYSADYSELAVMQGADPEDLRVIDDDGDVAVVTSGSDGLGGSGGGRGASPPPGLPAIAVAPAPRGSSLRSWQQQHEEDDLSAPSPPALPTAGGAAEGAPSIVDALTPPLQTGGESGSTFIDVPLISFAPEQQQQQQSGGGAPGSGPGRG